MTPEGWRSEVLSDAVDVNPPRPLQRGSIAPFVEMAAVAEDSPRIAGVSLRVFDGGGSRFTDGDVLLARITPCAENGKTAIVSGLGRAAFGSTEFIVLAPKEGSSTSDFIYYVAKDQRVRNQLIGKMTGTSGRRRIPSAALSEVAIPLPPLPEQRKIAAILSSVDDAIDAAQAVIDQLQVVKKAMMAELLTRGLPGRHTRFKKTEIGEVPEEWEVRPLSEMLQGIDAGWSPQCESTPPGFGEWGVLKLSAVTSGVFRPAESKALPAALEPRPELEVRDGDVVLARANGVLALVGRSAIVRASPPRLMLSDKLLRLRTDPARMTPTFVHFALQIPPVRAQMTGTTGGSHMRNITQGSLRALSVPVPGLDEQVRIADALMRVEERVWEEESALRAVGAVKSALMSVLLTGELRVTPDEAAP